MDLINLTYEALHRYFTRLSQSGYMKYSNVNTLLILLYIQELSKDSLSTEDKSIIDKAISCLQGTNCMIPYLGCKSTCN